MTDSGNAYNAAISPDGKYVLYADLENGKQSLWLRHIPPRSNTQVVAPIAEQYIGLTFSNDGNYLYFVRTNKSHPGVRELYLAPVLGGEPRLLISDVDGPVSFSPDGTRLVFQRDSPAGGEVYLMIANSDGSVQESARNFPRVTAGLFGRRSLLTRLFPNNRISARYLALASRTEDAPTPYPNSTPSAKVQMYRALSECSL